MNPANPYLLEVSVGSEPWTWWPPMITALVFGLVVGSILAYLTGSDAIEATAWICLTLIASLLVGTLASVIITGHRNDVRHENDPEQAITLAWPKELSDEVVLGPVNLTKADGAVVQRANLPDCVVTRRSGRYTDDVQTFSLSCDGELVKPVKSSIELP